MYDALVVGARCGGASCALQLARKGHKVLLLDRNTFPSDQTASTHMIWAGGVAELKRLDMLGPLAATNCPPMRLFNLDMGDFVLSAEAPPVDGVVDSYAPRRFVLDTLLVEAAADAGADVEERCSVEELLREGDAVTGVRFSAADGTAREAKARLVIGADGMNSTIAKLVDAPSFDELPQLQGTYYAYFSNFPLNDMEFFSRPGRMVYAWATNDGLTLTGICSPYEEFKKVRQDFDGAFYRELAELAPAFHDRAREARRETRWLGGAARNFRRRPWGPGWALVGDAGLTMDPITAAGITNALRDARFLAEAAHDGLSGTRPMDEAMAHYEKRRDEAVMALYQFTCDMGRLEPPTQEFIDLFTALQYSPEDTSDYFGIFAQSVSAADFFAPENMQRIIDHAQDAKPGSSAGPATRRSSASTA